MTDIKLHPMTDIPEVGRRIIIGFLIKKGNLEETMKLPVNIVEVNGKIGYWMDHQNFVLLSGISNATGWRYADPVTPEDKAEKIGISMSASYTDASEKQIIMSDSPEAAAHRTDITGWVSRHGRFFGKEERLARYDGCTHVHCEACETPVKKPYTHCKDCRDKRAVERYNALEYKDHDGETPLYSQWLDKYFFDIGELHDTVMEEEISIEVLQLVICNPVTLTTIDEEYWMDDLPSVPEEGELPSQVAEALQEFNNILKEAGPVSWLPGKFRTSIKLEKS